MYKKGKKEKINLPQEVTEYAKIREN